MAQIPGIFNAAQFFGNSSLKKGQQDSFWDQQSDSVNHSSGSVQYQRPFEGNSTSAGSDPFMTSVQNEFDGWDEWPAEDDVYGNDSFHQNHVGPYDLGSTPNHNTGYTDSQLVVPEHGHYQEDLSESSNSSSVESSPRGMDPELNNTWVEEETTPYAFSKYSPTGASSGQSMAPQTGFLQSSGADFFDHHFNGQSNTEQADVGEQSLTSNGRTYASVCQAGVPAAPYQDLAQNQYFNQEQSHVAPSSQTVGTPELFNPQDNELDAETWSQEPELGSWSPVYNHEETSNQQHTPESFQPGDAESMDDGGLDDCIQTAHPDISVQDISLILGNLQPRAFMASPATSDAMSQHSDFNPSLHEPVRSVPFAMQSGQKDSYLEEAQVSHQNFFDNGQPQASMEGMSEFHGNLQPGAFPVLRAESDSMLHHSDIEPSLQEPVQADSLAAPNGQKDSFHEEAQVSNLNFFGNEHQPQAPMEGMSEHLGNLQPGAFPDSPAEGDVMSHFSDLEPSSQEECEAVPYSRVPPGVQSNIPHSVAEQPHTLENMVLSRDNIMLHHCGDLEPAPSMKLPGFPPAVPQVSAQSIQQVSVLHPEPLQDMSHSNNDFVSHHSDLEPPFSMVPPGVPTSTQQDFFQKPESVQASTVPPGNLPFLPQASVQQPDPPRDMALKEDVFMLRRDLEPPPNMVPPGVPTSIPQASDQQPEPVQNMAENIPADPDHNAHVKLPSRENSLEDSLDRKSSMDSPSVTFNPALVVEPVQPPTLSKTPSEGTPVELFQRAPVEQMKLNMPSKMEGQFQPSGKQEATVDEPDSPRDAIQAAFLQKQLAGKAPASSPRTSLWMNSVSLPAPCVLAPAAVPAVESSELHGNDKVFPAGRKGIQPHVTTVPSQQTTPVQAEVSEPVQSKPFEPTKGQNIFASSQYAPSSETQGNALRELPDVSTTPASIQATGTELPQPVQSVSFQHTQGQGIYASSPYTISSAAQEKILRELPGVSSTPASMSATKQEFPQPVQLAPYQHTQSQEIFAPSSYMSLSAPQENILRELPGALATPASLLATQQELPQPAKSAPFEPTQGQDIFTPSPYTTSSAQEKVLRELPGASAAPMSMQAIQQELPQPGQPSQFEPTQGQQIYAPSPPAGASASVEKKRELSGASTAPAPMQMSLASLLQGGKGRPKKKTSKMDVGSSEDVNVPSQETLPPNSFTPQSGSPSIPPVNSLEESYQQPEQHLNNQSFDSADRTGHEHLPLNESDYHDPYSRENSRSRDDPYYEHNRRDPYYDQDRRENDRRDYDRRDYDRRGHDRRDYDRHDYDRRDRGEFDRRESDYSRRDYDSREYDRRDFGRRDNELRRDSYHDRRDPYYGYGPSRQGRRGYNEGRSSREDLYQAHDPGYVHSYHSGRSTPSSDYERNSPAYDYSSPSSYPSHQHGYPSYADSQSMDMYQYLTMLYYYYPQHYEQYCAQQGYYNMGYTPEQLAQFYSGIPYPPGYQNQQPEQAAEAEVQETVPVRVTPPVYSVQHPFVQFTGGSRLISLMSGEDEEGQPKCVIASVQMVYSDEEMEMIKTFPGPLSSMYSSRTEVISYCELRSTITDMSADGLVKSLIWKILANLVKHNGAFVASDLAELIMENWRSCNTSYQNEFLSAESWPPSSDYEKNTHLSVFREMLLAGATKDALEYTMRYGLWGHAMVLSSKMDKKVQNEVTNRFMKTMTDFDPIHTVYDHLSGRQPVALMTPDDWQRNLAAMVANPPRQHPQSHKRNMICLGDTLMANDQVWAAHLCYTLAGERFGFPSDEKTKMALIGVDHRKKTISDQHIPLENLQMMEVLEYAVSLNSEDHYIPVLQMYKYFQANKLADAGFTDEALHYADLTGKTIIKHPHHFNSTLVKNTKELTDRLNPEGHDIAVAETTEMLDRLLQAKEGSQISSSVTESEGEVEDPLAESSASFFSGYDPVNTPKHQVEKTEEVQHQDSWAEPTSSAPAVSQDSMADLRQDSWSGSMDTRATQPDLPSAQQLPLSTGPQPSWQRKEPPSAVDAPPQPPLFVPGPPVSQEIPGWMESERPAAVEEQPFYNQQSSWNDRQQPPWNDIQQPPQPQQPPWNDSQRSSWSEEIGYKEAKKVEPPLAKEPEPVAKEEPKPTPSEKAKKKAKNGSQGGWFSGLSGIIQKVIPRGPNEMILPDDSKKSIYWDEDLKKWVNTDEDEEEKAPPPPPPSDMQLGGGMPPPMPPPMPLGHGIPPNGGTAAKGVGGRAGSPPFNPTLMPNVPGRPTLPGSPQSSPGMPTGMATTPVASKFSRKAHGGSRHAKKYVDVLNPGGKSSNSAMLPSSLLPMMPMPGPEFRGNFFVPSPMNTDTSDERTDEQTLDQSPAIGNPSSRPSSRNEDEDGGDQRSQHSRSSSVSLASAEVRSYMMPQDPDPPPQEMNAAPPPMFFDPMAFSQSGAQASPRKSRYPGIRK